MTSNKIKMRGYVTNYIELGFIQMPGNKNIPPCILCGKSYSNAFMKFGQINDHFYKYHDDESDTPLRYFKLLESKKIRNYELKNYFSRTPNECNKYLEVNNNNNK